MNLDRPNHRDRMLTGLLSSSTHDEMVRSTVRLARLTFSAAAASVFLYDDEREALVFEASSGAGEDRLAGVAIPAYRGIAGWVFHSGETVIVDDVDNDPRFDREFAAGTGYIPRSIMAAPLEFEDAQIGVIEVLDPVWDRFGDMQAIDLLTELAAQSAGALSLLLAARTLSAGHGAGKQVSSGSQVGDGAAGGGNGHGGADWEGLEVALALAQTPPAAIHDLVRALVSLVGTPAQER
jgi:GAF domain-containing protein